MPLIRRNWTPRDADEWTREDWIAIVLSPLAYAALMVGTALSMLLMPLGFVILAAGVLLTLLMGWVINPKLSTISDEYEKKQHAYLEELERKVKWEDVP
jgi:antibiotic biosynthesis monooxygenase (ABM) superfamily enzyme